MRNTKVPRLALLGVAFLLVVGFLLIVAPLSVFLAVPRYRTYSIGWDVDPPDQLPTESGEPTGLAVELVREAAKRREFGSSGYCTQRVPKPHCEARRWTCGR